jgi:hypothetical protein
MVASVKSIGKKTSPSGSVTLRDPDVMKRIAETAYALWEKRGRPHGNDLRDWLEAEKIVLRNTSR